MDLPELDSKTSAAPLLLGRIGPASVMACLLCDALLRLLPPQYVTYRSWEPMAAFSKGNGGFAPNASYRNPATYGDLANLGNLPEYRQYRQESFTTDSEGNRNTAEPERPFAGVLLLGDSFAVGSGVSDELTLSVQLARVSGLSVYNGAMTRDRSALLDRLQMTRGLVVWQQSERGSIPVLGGDALPAGVKARLLRVLNRHVPTLARSYSPMRIICSRAIKALQNDRFLPNQHRSQAVVAKLRNGREMLFLPKELENSELDRSTDVRFFVHLQKELAGRGLEFLVVLVPDKYVVYRDLLQDLPAGEKRIPYMQLVEQSLAAAHVPVLNLTSRFRSRAAELLDSDEYIYWRDDTHWNAGGIRLAAQMLSETRSLARCSCR